jgi:hypothetical protein
MWIRTDKPISATGGCDLFDGHWVRDAGMGPPLYKQSKTCSPAGWNCKRLIGQPAGVYGVANVP